MKGQRMNFNWKYQLKSRILRTDYLKIRFHFSYPQLNPKNPCVKAHERRIIICRCKYLTTFTNRSRYQARSIPDQNALAWNRLGSIVVQRADSPGIPPRSRANKRRQKYLTSAIVCTHNSSRIAINVTQAISQAIHPRSKVSAHFLFSVFSVHLLQTMKIISCMGILQYNCLYINLLLRSHIEYI